MKIRWLNVAISAVLGFSLGFLNGKVFGSLLGLHTSKPIWGILILVLFAFTWLIVELFTIRWSRIFALFLAVVGGIGFGFYGLLENTHPTRGAIGFGIPALLAGALFGAIIGFLWDKIRKNTPEPEIDKNDQSYIQGGGLKL